MRPEPPSWLGARPHQPTLCCLVVEVGVKCAGSVVVSTNYDVPPDLTAVCPHRRNSVVVVVVIMGVVVHVCGVVVLTLVACSF